jgi:hypothetical protein
MRAKYARVTAGSLFWAMAPRIAEQIGPKIEG